MMRYSLAIFLLSIILLAQNAYASKPGPTPTPSPVKLVCIDPGHGGNDSGTGNLDLSEKAVNLETALLLETKLITAGFSVELTRRDNDTTLSNADRYNFCNSKGASILLSIHHNGSSNTSLDYTSALYMKKSDLKLAQAVSDKVSSQLGLENRGVSRFASGVLLKANMPAAISEGFFLTNPDEYTRIKTEGRLESEANALFEAIQAYFNN